MLIFGAKPAFSHFKKADLADFGGSSLFKQRFLIKIETL